MTLRATSLALARQYAPEFLRRLWRQTRTRQERARQRRAAIGPLFVFGEDENEGGRAEEECARQEVFQITVRECEQLAAEAGGGPAPSALVRQLAHTELWRANGVVPQATLGLGRGEVAAVYAAGGLDLAGAMAAGTLWREAARLERPENAGEPRTLEHENTLRQRLQGMRLQPLALPCYLGSLGRIAPAGTVLGADYWLGVLRFPVLEQAAFAAARDDGHRLFVPVGPPPRGLTKSQVPPGLTFAETKARLARRGLVRPSAPRPVMTLPEFLARFAPQTWTFVGHPAWSFAYLRQAGSVHYLPREKGWLVIEAKLIHSVLGAPETYSSTINVSLNEELVGADPPEHTELRAFFQPFFAPAEMRVRAAEVEERLNVLAAGKAHGRPFDFVTQMAIPLVHQVSARLLGLSEEESFALQGRLTGPLYAFEYADEVRRFVAELLPGRGVSEKPTMIEQLAEGVRSGRFTVANASSLGKLMWEGGIITTSMTICSATYFLLMHPDVAAELRTTPELVEPFVEEILRLEAPLNTLLRVTTRPVNLGEQELPAGAALVCSLTAANRDPDRYPRPDDLDLRRGPARNLTFAGGIHVCLGAMLARLEARAVVQWVLARGPSLRLAEPLAQPQYWSANNLRALASLPVTLQPASVN